MYSPPTVMAGPSDYSFPVRRSLTPVGMEYRAVSLPSVMGLAYSAPGYEMKTSYEMNTSYVTASPQVAYMTEAPQVIQTSYVAEAPRVYVAAAPEVYEQHLGYQEKELRRDEFRLLPNNYGYEAQHVTPQIVYEFQAPEPERRVERVRSPKAPLEPEPEPLKREQKKVQRSAAPPPPKSPEPEPELKKAERPKIQRAAPAPVPEKIVEKIVMCVLMCTLACVHV